MKDRTAPYDVHRPDHSNYVTFMLHIVLTILIMSHMMHIDLAILIVSHMMYIDWVILIMSDMMHIDMGHSNNITYNCVTYRCITAGHSNYVTCRFMLAGGCPYTSPPPAPTTPSGSSSSTALMSLSVLSAASAGGPSGPFTHGLQRTSKRTTFRRGKELYF